MYTTRSLLAASWNPSFDTGPVAVPPDGTVLASRALTDAALVVLCLPSAVKFKLWRKHEPYISWHWNHVFRVA